MTDGSGTAVDAGVLEASAFPADWRSAPVDASVGEAPLEEGFGSSSRHPKSAAPANTSNQPNTNDARADRQRPMWYPIPVTRASIVGGLLRTPAN